MILFVDWLIVQVSTALHGLALSFFPGPVRFQWCVDKCLTTDSLGESDSSLLTALSILQCRTSLMSTSSYQCDATEAGSGRGSGPLPWARCACPRPLLRPASAARWSCLSFSLPSVTLRRDGASPVPGSSHRGQLESSSQQLSWEVLLVPVFRRGHRAQEVRSPSGASTWNWPVVRFSFSLSNSLYHRMSVSEGLCSRNCVVVWAAFSLEAAFSLMVVLTRKSQSSSSTWSFFIWLLDKSLEDNGNTLLGIPERLEGVVRIWQERLQCIGAQV